MSSGESEPATQKTTLWDEKQQTMKDKNEHKDIEEKRKLNDSLNKSESEKRLPGEYPPNEDIMNRMNTERVSIDPETIGNSKRPGAIQDKMEFPSAEETPEEASPRGPADLTEEDMEALGPRDLSLDGGDDEKLKHRVWPVDFAARDLDVPNGDASRIDALDQGDEENDHYSLGGDDKDSLEDDPTRTFG